MSQIAAGYVVPGSVMEQAASCCARGDQRGVRAALAPHVFEPFGWSGYVILNEWLREHAVELPVSGATGVRSTATNPAARTTRRSTKNRSAGSWSITAC